MQYAFSSPIPHPRVALLTTPAEFSNMLLCANGTPTFTLKDLPDLFRRYVEVFSKEYSPDDSQRYKAFVQNIHYFESHCIADAQGYQIGINKFSDLSQEEFANLYLRPIDASLFSTMQVPEKNTVPSAKRAKKYIIDQMDGGDDAPIDWRQYGGVTPVKVDIIIIHYYYYSLLLLLLLLKTFTQKHIPIYQ